MKGCLYQLDSLKSIVMDFPSVLDVNKEIFINVHPDVAFADPDIRYLKSESRQCYFGKEKKLKLYTPYTRSNCFDECISDQILEKCDCAFFHMPRDEGVRATKLRFTKQYICAHCLPLCEDITYRFETTSAGLQNTSKLWQDPYLEVKVPEWANHSLSLVHIFFGTDAVVPKLRYGTTDLIANTGGILGLCLGFSALSAAELVYFVSVRALWKYFRGRKSNGVRE
ncbi:Pickpocket protein 28 [Orchesella cincta]|uniref:Pickpocket protein 28 n=1 Tax=Orchesella cincta TaxID=48709 RepID=A0A1D2M3D5_ORCCI|nr:Pickpocket protein 28 [Orchesella cincta]